MPPVNAPVGGLMDAGPQGGPPPPSGGGGKPPNPLDAVIEMLTQALQVLMQLAGPPPGGGQPPGPQGPPPGQ